ncbi:MAG TPA: mechanosensitive ion channel domain-containing protein, partial [Puia sp.]|nr:mechanosensitive ion channel domain-containing protein [Puia sp.]
IIHLGKHIGELKERKIVYFINFVFFCQLISILLNLWGRANLSKTFLVNGYSGVVIAILFLWVVRLVNEGLTLASAVYKKQNRQLFFINFNRVGNEVHPGFYVVLVVGWFFLTGKQFYALRKLQGSLVDAITASRTIGSYKFSIMGMLEFVVILACSVLLSRLVSLFASEPASDQKEKEGKRFKLGSYLLLVRILIICVGVFLAFAAAGISLDKITILFGALGVGIGLGLQGLVTNLVSGLILSFERPVNVGDLIELNGRLGTMRSIGFRSSIIAGADGSSIIIPNGELLSQQMVNWTMGKNLKLNSLTFTVAFGSDLEKVKTLLFQLIGEDDRILHYPAPDVFLKGFNKGEIDVEVIFWPKHIALSSKVRSDLVVKIDHVFKKEGIVIPLPQQDLYVHAEAPPKESGQP